MRVLHDARVLGEVARSRDCAFQEDVRMLAVYARTPEDVRVSGGK